MNHKAIFQNLPELLTERLRLRPLRSEDADDMFAYAKNPEVSQFTTWETHPDIAATQGYISYVQARYLAGEPETWGVELRSTGCLIGTTGLLNLDAQANHIEIGYVLAPPYYGQGYATEAARAAVHFAFTTLAVNKVVACCAALNVASERIMQKLGMTYEGCFRDHYCKRGSLLDIRFYGLLARDYLIDDKLTPYIDK